METKETLPRTELRKTVVEDSEFYKYIFKKTEKVVCAVFYILRSEQCIGQKDSVTADVELSATALLNTSLQSLKATVSYTEVHAREIQLALIALESKLRVAHASRLLREGYLEVFLHEIDSVQRALRKYIDQGMVYNPLNTESKGGEQNREKKALPQRKVVVGSMAGEPHETTHTLPRRERILSIIKDSGEAMIKDIARVVTDCSEKTIQRELISLIKDNIIIRDGERRWSKYRLSQ
jgi:predicted transcriptional regulator